jgi:hypothetical protein
MYAHSDFKIPHPNNQTAQTPLFTPNPASFQGRAGVCLGFQLS